MKLSQGGQWPMIIVALLVATAAGQGVMMWKATHDSTLAIEPDYYKKAVAYDEVIAQEAVNASLGWRAVATVGSEVGVTLTDRAGRAIDGAAVTVTAIHNLDGSHHIIGRLTAAGAGRYAAPLPLDRAGLWELRIEAERGAEKFTSSLRVDAPRP
jgi:nitrogen fixation protein FixH